MYGIRDSRHVFLGRKSGVVEIPSGFYWRSVRIVYCGWRLCDDANGELAASFNLLGHKGDGTGRIVVMEAMVVVFGMGIIPSTSI